MDNELNQVKPTHHVQIITKKYSKDGNYKQKIRLMLKVVKFQKKKNIVILSTFRSSDQICSVKKAFLKYFEIFTG